MPPHVPETCNESNGSWLPLIEYSVKTGVSLSTIRRKIKTGSIQYRLEKGRYLILHSSQADQSLRQAPLHSVEAPNAGYAEPVSPSPLPSASLDVDSWQNRPLAPLAPKQTAQETPEEEDKRVLPFVERAVGMVSDAFEYALVQKEEHIRILEHRNKELEERVEELKLLVRVLEDKYKVRY
ncbi:hypothetical protein K2X33_08925 [bacterium]|nr:hypothetical protein [bacterium]